MPFTEQEKGYMVTLAQKLEASLGRADLISLPQDFALEQRIIVVCRKLRNHDLNGALGDLRAALRLMNLLQQFNYHFFIVGMETLRKQAEDREDWGG